MSIAIREAAAAQPAPTFEPIAFERYDGDVAVFTDLQDAGRLRFTKTELKGRLQTLQDRGAPSNVTAQALAAWPP